MAFDFDIPEHTILAELGRGGMAQVFLARDKFQREVAVKVIDARFKDEPDLLRRFDREAVSAARLGHPNIVPIFDRGHTSDGRPFLSMQYIADGSLQDRLARDGSLAVPAALKIIRQIASALSAAHQQGIVHRDLKPDNVLLHGETAYLADFGIAKVLGASTLTAAGMSPGTMQYGSPEHSNAAPVDARSDLYSLGIIFYELLTGRPPIESDTPAGLVYAIGFTPPAPLPTSVQGLQPLLDLLLAKDPEARLQSAARLVQVCDEMADNWTRFRQPDRLLDEVDLGLGSPEAPPIAPQLEHWDAAPAEDSEAQPSGASVREEPAHELPTDARGGRVGRGALDLLRSTNPWVKASALIGACALGYLGWIYYSSFTQFDLPAPVAIATDGSDASTPHATLGEQQTLPAELGRLWIEAHPPDAQITLPNAAVDYQPGVALPLGEIWVRGSLPGFVDADRLIAIGPGANRYELRLAAHSAGETEQSDQVVARTFVDKRVGGSAGPTMVIIPAGRFYMGSQENEVGREADEGPRRLVSIAAFALGQTEVTAAQWQTFLSISGWQWHPPTNCQPGGDNHPAVCISWDDARAYTTWLAQQTGLPYRLPSEAELEYSLRAGSDTRFGWGETEALACEFANIFDQTAGGKLECADGFAEAAPVASFAANAFGLFDVSGNVWEWAEDCYVTTYAGAPADGAAWTFGADCDARVLRGGAWAAVPEYARSALRNAKSPSSVNDSTGFRIARDL